MEAHGKELIHAMTNGEFILNALHLHDVFAANKEYAQHLNRTTAEQLTKRPTVLPMGSLLEELRTSPVDLHHAVLESDGTFTRVINDLEFRNWGRTVQNQPAVTFFPHSKVAVCNIVKWSLENGYTTVRASGYRHTWSNLYSQTGQVLVAMLPLKVTNKLPAPIPELDPDNDLMGIVSSARFRSPAASPRVSARSVPPRRTRCSASGPTPRRASTPCPSTSSCQRSLGAAPTRPFATAPACAIRL